MQNTGQDEVQAGIKIARRYIYILRYQNDTIDESERRVKKLA